MNPISLAGPASPATRPQSAAATDSATGASSGSGGGDLLAAMNPAMDAAFAVGRPTDSRGAAAILGTAGAYVSGAQATLAKVDDGIARREQQLVELRHSDPEAARKLEGELELLRRLRDRIELSIERVTETLAGEEETPQERADRERVLERRAQRRREDVELLEQRRQLLGGHVAGSIAPADASLVAGAYGAARAAAGAGGGGAAA